MEKLPEIFESFSEARRNGFLEMKRLKEEGRRVAGTFCSYVPYELITAAGLIPVGLCSSSDETIPEAEKTLPRSLCPLIKASYGFAVSNKCPYMYFSDIVIGETTCDGKIKMYELLGKIKNVYVMELPRSQKKEASRMFWRNEVYALKQKLEETFSVKITEDALRESIRRRNKERALLKEIYELSTNCPPPISGLRQGQILYGSQFKFTHEEKIKELESIIKTIKELSKSGGSTISKSAKRILITGCPTGGAVEKLIRVIEESGGVVVAYENCTGAKQYDRQVDESVLDGSEQTMLDTLADYYLDIGCSIMSPNPNRFELLGRLCNQFKVDGVIEMVLQSCHTYSVESQTVRGFLKERGVPFLSLETDYSPGDTEQLKVRSGAFIEML